MNTKTGINSFENIGHILKGLGQMQGRLNYILHLLDYYANLLRGNRTKNNERSHLFKKQIRSFKTTNPDQIEITLPFYLSNSKA